MRARQSIKSRRETHCCRPIRCEVQNAQETTEGVVSFFLFLESQAHRSPDSVVACTLECRSSRVSRLSNHKTPISPGHGAQANHTNHTNTANGSSNPCRSAAASRVASRRVVGTSARPHALMSTRQKSFFDQDPKAKVRCLTATCLLPSRARSLTPSSSASEANGPAHATLRPTNIASPLRLDTL